MTTISIVLIIYIIISQLWSVLFINAKRDITSKTWFIVLTCLFMPILFSIVFIQIVLKDIKNKKILKEKAHEH